MSWRSSLPTSAPAASSPRRSDAGESRCGDSTTVVSAGRRRTIERQRDDSLHRDGLVGDSARAPPGRTATTAPPSTTERTRSKARKASPRITATAKATREFLGKRIRSCRCRPSSACARRAGIRQRRRHGHRAALRALLGGDEQEPPHVLLQRGQHRRQPVEEERARRMEVGPAHSEGAADHERVLRQPAQVQPRPHDTARGPGLGRCEDREARQRGLDARHQHDPADAGVQRADLARARGLRAPARERRRHEDLRLHRAVFREQRSRDVWGQDPRSFWKIIVFIHDETGKLCATGYEMSQKQSRCCRRRSSCSARSQSPQLNVATQVSDRVDRDAFGPELRRTCRARSAGGRGGGSGGDGPWRCRRSSRSASCADDPRISTLLRQPQSTNRSEGDSTWATTHSKRATGRA